MGSFGVGPWELVMLVVIGLLVLGPERLPRVASQIGRWVGRARRTANQLRYQIEREVALADIEKASTKRKEQARPDISGSSTAESGQHAADATGNAEANAGGAAATESAPPAETVATGDGRVAEDDLKQA